MDSLTEKKHFPKDGYNQVTVRKNNKEVSKMMFDFNNKKNRQIVSSIIVILLVLAMVAPIVLSALNY